VLSVPCHFCVGKLSVPSVLCVHQLSVPPAPCHLCWSQASVPPVPCHLCFFLRCNRESPVRGPTVCAVQGKLTAQQLFAVNTTASAQPVVICRTSLTTLVLTSSTIFARMLCSAMQTSLGVMIVSNAKRKKLWKGTRYISRLVLDITWPILSSISGVPPATTAAAHSMLAW